MNDNNERLNSDIKFGLKSFLSICAILLGIMILVGILTYVIPTGQYAFDENGDIIPDSFSFIESETRLPVYRWFSAPIEALIIGEGNFNIIQIIAVLLVLGGTFKVLDLTGGLYAVLKLLVDRFYHKRYLLIWVVTLFMMLLSAFFGLQEELLILFPIFLSFAKAMHWSKLQAISLILITTGVGFTTALLNPFTVGVASDLAGVNILDGIWYRLLIFAVLYVVTSSHLVFMAKRDEKLLEIDETEEEFVALTEEERRSYVAKSKGILILFCAATLVLVLASAIPPIADLGLSMVFMALVFVSGTFIIGKRALGSMKETARGFFGGVRDMLPSIVIILLAFSVKYIAENGNILHTLFHYFRSFTASLSPYVTVVLLYLLVLLFEFFIPGATGKAFLLIPLLTLAPLPGISKNIVILAFLFGDGYTNVLFPTCSTLVVGLGLAEVSYIDWIKRTGLFQLLLFACSVAFLLLAVLLGV
jgi:uncharacterized ion transporter superfamily protein YfcC